MEHCWRRRFVLLFVSAFLVVVGTFGVDLCDDGRTGLEKDLGDKENYECTESEHWSITDGPNRNECTNHTLMEHAVCMSDDITYLTTPPLGGTYRRVPPQFGEYSYLPPERWVHALGLGGVVFLYHPCTPSEQVTELRNLARGCLQRHIITPYPRLTKEQPLAIVVWGCVLHMAQVEGETAKTWIRDQELSVLAVPFFNDRYNHSLLHSAEVVSNVLDNKLCPQAEGELNTPPSTNHPTELLHTPHVSESHNPSTEQGSKHDDPVEVHTDEHPSEGHDEEEPSHPDQSLVYVTHVKEDAEEIYSRKWIFLSIFTIFCVLFVVGLVMSIVLQRKFRWIKSSYKPRKYKFVGSFFPSGGGGTYIPPTGTPKVPGAEQHRLLDSDEEEV